MCIERNAYILYVCVSVCIFMLKERYYFLAKVKEILYKKVRLKE